MYFKKEKIYLIILSIFFTLLNISYYARNGKFHFNILYLFWQFLDPYLLKHDLLRSIFFLHSQPPLFNLITGLILKNKFFPPDKLAASLFILLGFLSVIFLFKSMVLLEVKPVISFFITIFFMLNPSFLIFENFYFYPHITASLLILSIYFLIKFLKEKKEKYGTLFSVSLLTLCLIRSLYHIVFFIPLFFIFREKKSLLKKMAVVVTILFLFYLKNFIIFKTFSLSSWAGMNFAKVFGYSTKEEKLKGVTGSLDDVVFSIYPFSPLKKYPLEFQEIPEKFQKIPALSGKYKHNGRDTNYNNYAYITISKIYLKKYLHLLLKNPLVYIRGVLKSFEFYLAPEYSDFHLHPYFNKYIFYLIYISDSIYLKVKNNVGKIYSPTFFIYPLFILFILFTFPIFIFNLKMEREDWRKLSIIFIFYVIIYTMYVGIFFECGENGRFRFLTHSYYLIMWGVFFYNLNQLERILSKKNLKNNSGGR